MGTNQSLPGDPKSNHRQSGGRSASGRQQQQLSKKGRKLSRNNVSSSGGHYEHLTCTNDNSARSSPSEAHSASFSSLNNHANKTSTSFCLCFQCVEGNDLSARGNSNPIPGRSNDSVALLHLSRRSPSFIEGTSFPSARNCVDGVLSQEELSEDVSAPENLTQIQNGNALLPVITRPKEPCCLPVAEDLPPRGKNENVGDDAAGGNTDRSRRSILSSKKYSSFPFGLFSRSKLSSASEGNEPCYSDTKHAENKSLAKTKGKEADCTSHGGTSCEDSGKASESEICPLMSDVRNDTKAPIAKIDSLETSSIDSLDSDDLMLGTNIRSYDSIEKLGRQQSFELTDDLSDKTIEVHRTQNLNQSLKSNNVLVSDGSLKQQSPLSCSSAQESEFDERYCHAVEAGVCSAKEISSSDFVLYSDSVEAEKRPRELEVTDAEIQERVQTSCSIPVNSLPTITCNNGATQLGEDVLVLNCEAHSDLANDLEDLRTALLTLGVLMSQGLVDDAAFLDSKNNNLYHPGDSECAGNRCQEIIDDNQHKDGSPSVDQLATENVNLKRQLASLQTIISEQQQLIFNLQEKLAEKRCSAAVTISNINKD